MTSTLPRWRPRLEPSFEYAASTAPAERARKNSAGLRRDRLQRHRVGAEPTPSPGPPKPPAPPPPPNPPREAAQRRRAGRAERDRVDREAGRPRARRALERLAASPASGARRRGRGSTRACSRRRRVGATVYDASAPFWSPTRLDAEPHRGRDRVADRGAAEAAELSRRVDRLADELVVASSAASRPAPPREEHEADTDRLGTLSRNVWMAFCAAMSRVGLTSMACIEPETSSTRITVALSLVVVDVTCGRAPRRTTPRARRGRARR